MRRALALLVALATFAAPARAHEVRPAYLELTQIGGDTYDLLWKVPARGDQRLGLHLRLPEGTLVVALPVTSFAGNAWIERSRIRRPSGLIGGEFTVEGLAATLTDALARVVRADGSTQVERLTPSNPSFIVEASPKPIEIVRTYLVLGVEHILLGTDHLLFLLALLLLVSGWRRLVATITAFSVSHCFTLTLATLGYVRIPAAPTEAAIALSILFVAGEIVHRDQGRAGFAHRWPWSVSFLFGLLHGLGFAGALHEIGLPQTEIPLALAFFSVGVELGQLSFVTTALLLMAAGRRLVIALRDGADLPLPRPALLETAGAYAIGGVAAYWLIERTASFVA